MHLPNRIENKVVIVNVISFLFQNFCSSRTNKQARNTAFLLLGHIMYEAPHF